MIECEVLSTRKKWLEHRKKGIGGSECASILGLNPYMTIQQLYKYKAGLEEQEDISEKPYVKYGTDAEKPLRELFILDFPQYEMEYIKNNSYYNDKYPFALASVDGLLKDKDGRTGIWECKTTNVFNGAMWEKWNNQVPANYYCQLLHYMAVLDADFAILKAQLKSIYEGVPQLTTRHYTIERADVEDDIQALMTAEADFWQCVTDKKMPPLILPEI